MANISQRRGKWVVHGRDATGKQRWVTCRTRDQAKLVLAAKELEWRRPSPGDPNMTLGQAFERYFQAKARKRSLPEDRRNAEHLKAEFGEHTKLRAISASRIAL